MATAFVLSGGASLGAVQVGMLRGLAEQGITPDLIVGTSVGAVNGGWIASRPDASGIDALADLWLSLSRKDIFPTHPISGLLGFLGRSSHLVPNSGLRRLLSDQLEFARLEDAPIPFHVVATDVISGTDVLLSSGDAVDAIAASAAIPGIFPPVNINGRDLMDGGVVNNTPLSHAVALGRPSLGVADWLLVRPTRIATERADDGIARPDLDRQSSACRRCDPLRARGRPARHPTAVSGRDVRSGLLARGNAYRAVACDYPGIAGSVPSVHRPGRIA